ncbi:Mitochondrial Heat shock protein 70 [Carpediemonas membranifera]|uniref:Mitochondrial Heat shock protein 70 n=1 Tax=Carpediemonas membranifera TaxID=201153 RepID=A0A8J6B8G0_9EUKA|nr:Mitochondrial Heat shock protein 70 [Carpediemonas membranifera]|eukprot:KAG9395339.1 Mitochondrial Heat shock protein 70 [Carpediemonas membranifera]
MLSTLFTRTPAKIPGCFSRALSSSVIGIDLGTTNSCVGVFTNEPMICKNVEGDRTTPSTVAFTKDKKTLVGAPAKRQALTNSANTFFATKRLIGRRYQELEDWKTPYSIVQSDSGDAWVESPAMGKTYSPSQIGAYVLTKMKQSAEKYLNDEVNKAVITVPAYFNDSQRQATKDAGQIAGLEVLRIINEPTAAAIAYGLDKTDKDQRIAVYDLGGGTFDISILELSGGVFEVKSTNGNTFLGGEDFDNVLVNWMLTEIKKEHKLDVSGEIQAMQRLKEMAEKTKIDLSVMEEVDIQLPFLAQNKAGDVIHFERRLTRPQFERMVGGLVTQTEGPCKAALKDAGLTPADVDEVILVGGMTRMPLVQQRVEKLFGKAANTSVDPDEVVALGAAIQGGILKGDVSSVVLLDVTPLSLGLETRGGVFTRLIPRNTTIPTKRAQMFSTAVDNQTAVNIRVFQGERDIAEHNKMLGEFELTGVPPAPRGVPQIEVSFDIDANGIVTVSALDKATNKKQDITVQTSGGLSEEEVARMVEEAEASREEDKIATELLELKNVSDNLVYSTEGSLEEHAARIPTGLVSDLRDMIAKVRGLMSKPDCSYDELFDAKEALRVAAAKIGESMYGQKA